MNGLDTNSGLSPAAAWRTLGKASQTMMLPGAQVRVKAGDVTTATTANRIVPISSGAPGAPITWSRYGGDGGRPILDGLNGVQLIFFNNQSWHTITGFELRNVPQTYAVYLSDAGNITLDDVSIHDVEEGIHPTPTNASVAFTLRNSTIRNVRLLPDGGGQGRAMSIVNSAVNWRVENTEVSDCDLTCLSDQGTGTVFENVRVHDCGQANVVGDRQALWLRGQATFVQNSRFERAPGDCVQVGVLDGGVLTGNVMAQCENCVSVTGNAGGDVVLRRNVASGCLRLVAQSNPSPKVRDLLYVNNTFFGGLADGGPTTVGVMMRPSNRGAFENNIVGGFIAPPGPGLLVAGAAGWAAGFTERGNGYETDGGLQFGYDVGFYTYVGLAQFLGNPVASVEGNPLFVNAAAGDLHLSPDSGFRDKGVANPSTGAIGFNCDGGYCGAAPEPGAFELVP